MRALRWPALALAASPLLLAACGSSSQASLCNERGKSAPSAGAQQFSASGMAIHFKYPTSLQAVTLSSLRRSAGGVQNGSFAAVGIGPYDLLIVARYPGLSPRVTASNVARVRPQFDALVSQTVGRKITGTTGSANGLPAICWPRVPLSGLPATASVRIVDVFTGDDEYELQCQATPPKLTAIESACREMLATLTTS
jgi:hypothetical protein